MKLLCANCDECMSCEEAAGPEEDSLSITFSCPRCGNRTSLLTNPGETRLLNSLDVQLGGRRAPAEPMQLVRRALARQRGDVFRSQPAAGADRSLVTWAQEAEARLQRVPAAARSMARRAIERYAMDEGHAKITVEVMDLAREKIGM